MKKNNKKGFTLAELLIVIAIIAVLVAIAIPVFTTSLENAKDQVAAANVRTIKALATADYVEDQKLDVTTYYIDANGDISTIETTGATKYTVSVDGQDIKVE